VLSSHSSDINWPTFTVATVGAVTGVFSAVWSVVPYVSAGAKIQVTIKYVWVVGKGPVFEVDAFNRRRGAVEIRNWGILPGPPRKGGGVFLGNAIDSDGDGPRKTVQGLHSATWRVLARDLVVYELNADHSVEVRGVVDLGNGKSKASKPLKLPAGSLHQAPSVIDDA
jgi:hypothetical protein